MAIAFNRRREEIADAIRYSTRTPAGARVSRSSAGCAGLGRKGLLEAMLDPVARALANAPVDDEPVTEEEERAVAEARESLQRNGGIPFEQVVAELGFTLDEVRNYQDPS